MNKGNRPSLHVPQKLLDELGTSDTKQSGSRRGRLNIAAQRKQQRRASRVEKKCSQPKPKPAYLSDRTKAPKQSVAIRPPASAQIGQYSLPGSRRLPIRESLATDTSQSEDEDERAVGDVDEDEDGDDGVDDLASRRIPRSIRNQLEDDDAQIARLEKKLGRKRKQPDDDVSSLFKDLDGISDDDDDEMTAKSTSRTDQEVVDWLRAKRRKASREDVKRFETAENDQEDDEFGSFSDDDEVAHDAMHALADGEDFTDKELDLEDLDDRSQASIEIFKKRENPYTAPVTKASAKYVPPSKRLTATSEDEQQQRLRRQIQGLLNRLSESNMVDIVKQVGQLYSNHARHDVSRILLNHLTSLLSDRTALNDTFIILHAGFVAALHRTVGMEFGAAAVQRFVEEYDLQAKEASEDAGKRCLNLVHILAELYNFQVIGSNLIYDFIRGYIQRLSETDAELLLKVVRNTGFQLRQDDPAALKEISIMLQETVKRLGGEASLNVRTRFMIETIDNLKNNKNKTNQGASVINVEHVLRIKKTLGGLQNTSGITIRSTEPLRIGLADLRNSDLKGKWWLVGASFRDETQLQVKLEKKMDTAIPVPSKTSTDFTASDGLPDMATLAQAFGMNTDVRKALFVNIMTAATVEHARERFIKMRLTKKQMREVPAVLVRCATAEKTFNPYYADIARKFSQEREVRKAMWNPLLDMLTNLNDDQPSEDEREDGDQASWWQAPHAIFNTAKLYGTLIAESVVPLTVLAGQDLLHPPEQVRTFLELIFVGIFCQAGKGNSSKLKQVIRAVAEKGDSGSFLMLLRRFISKHVAQTILVAAKEKKIVRWACVKCESIFGELAQQDVKSSGA